MTKANNKEGDAKVTKIRLIREVNNCMCHNFYYEVRFRVYANEHHYWKGNFVVWFDTYDLADFYDKDTFTKKEIREYIEMLASNFLDAAPKKNVTRETMAGFYAACSETIANYNGHNRRAA